MYEEEECSTHWEETFSDYELHLTDYEQQNFDDIYIETNEYENSKTNCDYIDLPIDFDYEEEVIFTPSDDDECNQDLESIQNIKYEYDTNTDYSDDDEPETLNSRVEMEEQGFFDSLNKRYCEDNTLIVDTRARMKIPSPSDRAYVEMNNILSDLQVKMKAWTSSCGQHLALSRLIILRFNKFIRKDILGRGQ